MMALYAINYHSNLFIQNMSNENSQNLNSEFDLFD